MRATRNLPVSMLSAESRGDIARRGGWVQAANAFLGMRGSAKLAGQLAEARALRREAVRYGTHVRLLAALRFEIVAADTRTDYDLAGFDPAWVATLPEDRWCAVMRHWWEAGYRLERSPHFDEGLWDRVFSVRGGGLPVPYAVVDDAAQAVRVHRFVLDLRIPACRDWVAAEAMRALDATGCDAGLLGVKRQFWQAPQAWRQEPTSHTGSPGAVTPTPFGRGEWEAAMADLIARLDDAGYPLAVNTNDDRTGRADPWDWMTPETRDRVLGERMAV